MFHMKQRLTDTQILTNKDIYTTADTDSDTIVWLGYCSN